MHFLYILSFSPLFTQVLFWQSTQTTGVVMVQEKCSFQESCWYIQTTLF